MGVLGKESKTGQDQAGRGETGVQRSPGAYKMSEPESPGVSHLWSSFYPLYGSSV